MKFKTTNNMTEKKNGWKKCNIHCSLSVTFYVAEKFVDVGSTCKIPLRITMSMQYTYTTDQTRLNPNIVPKNLYF